MQPDSQDTIQSLRAASRAYSDSSILMHEAIARKAGLSGTDHKYLGLILQQGQVTAGELATLTNLTTGAITGLVDRLVKLKLVKRQYDKHDRRKVYIVPHKENIQTLLEPLFVPLQQQTLAFYDTFSAEELQVILRYFSGAIDIMTNITQQLNDTTQSTQP